MAMQMIQMQRCSIVGGRQAFTPLFVTRGGSARFIAPSQQQATSALSRTPAVRVFATQSGAPPAKAGKKKTKKMVDLTGDVGKDLGNGMFQVKLENGVTVIAHLSGKIRQNRIKVMVGDKVTVELSPYDLTKGRITLRHKAGQVPPPAGEAPPANP